MAGMLIMDKRNRRHIMEIKQLIIDVDGTLTDSSIYYGSGDIEIKAFSTKDGAIIKALRQLNIDVIFLTGRESIAVGRRAADLGVTAIQGIDDKLFILRKLLTEHKINLEQCAYIGDDLNDYSAMKCCYFKACPADAATEIREICNYISPFNGGHGAVRDICEYILKKNEQYKEFLNSFGIVSTD
jgi:3-deoxy-D-manno-octulosonate 8-phosphate phosphatase (KDO 8-P phosphatase)